MSDGASAHSEPVDYVLEYQPQRSFLISAAGTEVLVQLVHEFHSVPRKLAFASAREFECTALSTRVITAGSLAGAPFSELLV